MAIRQYRYKDCNTQTKMTNRKGYPLITFSIENLEYMNGGFMPPLEPYSL